jgi:hypothetical protein
MKILGLPTFPIYWGMPILYRSEDEIDWLFDHGIIFNYTEERLKYGREYIGKEGSVYTRYMYDDYWGSTVLGRSESFLDLIGPQAKLSKGKKAFGPHSLAQHAWYSGAKPMNLPTYPLKEGVVGWRGTRGFTWLLEHGSVYRSDTGLLIKKIADGYALVQRDPNAVLSEEETLLREVMSLDEFEDVLQAEDEKWLPHRQRLYRQWHWRSTAFLSNAVMDQYVAHRKQGNDAVIEQCLKAITALLGNGAEKCRPEVITALENLEANRFYE